jgi:excisionase family DNA binding protein
LKLIEIPISTFYGYELKYFLNKNKQRGVMSNIVTAKELGKYLKLSESTIYKLAAKGELPGFKIGDSWRFDMNEIMHVIKKAKKISEKKGEDK